MTKTKTKKVYYTITTYPEMEPEVWPTFGKTKCIFEHFADIERFFYFTGAHVRSIFIK